MTRTVFFWLSVLGLVLSLTALLMTFRHPRTCVYAPVIIPTSGPALEPTPPACIPRNGATTP
jgi:hypothetical protein